MPPCSSHIEQRADSRFEVIDHRPKNMTLDCRSAFEGSAKDGRAEREARGLSVPHAAPPAAPPSAEDDRLLKRVVAVLPILSKRQQLLLLDEMGKSPHLLRGFGMLLADHELFRLLVAAMEHIALYRSADGGRQGNFVRGMLQAVGRRHEKYAEIAVYL